MLVLKLLADHFSDVERQWMSEVILLVTQKIKARLTITTPECNLYVIPPGMTRTISVCSRTQTNHAITVASASCAPAEKFGTSRLSATRVRFPVGPPLSTTCISRLARFQRRDERQVGGRHGQVTQTGGTTPDQRVRVQRRRYAYPAFAAI